MKKRLYTGLNVQFPISQLILNGKKTVETRTYPIPEKYLNQEMVMIETPGESGNFISQAVCIITFSECYQYKTLKSFRSEYPCHMVGEKSKWDWSPHKPKWAWKISEIKVLKKPIKIRKRKGIVFTKDISI